MCCTAGTAYVNVLAVKEGREKDEAILKLVEVLKSDEASGWFTLTAMIGGTGEIRLARKGDLVTFSGLEPGAATLNCGPDAGFHILPLNLERGSGTLWRTPRT